MPAIAVITSNYAHAEHDFVVVHNVWHIVEAEAPRTRPMEMMKAWKEKVSPQTANKHKRSLSSFIPFRAVSSFHPQTVDGEQKKMNPLEHVIDTLFQTRFEMKYATLLLFIPVSLPRSRRKHFPSSSFPRSAFLTA